MIQYRTRGIYCGCDVRMRPAAWLLLLLPMPVPIPVARFLRLDLAQLFDWSLQIFSLLPRVRHYWWLKDNLNDYPRYPRHYVHWQQFTLNNM